MKAPREEIYTAYQHTKHNVKKYIQWFTTLTLTTWVYIYSCKCCCLPNLQNHAKFSQNSNLYQFKVIQGHRYWCHSI